jgi:RpiR family transcriptional regulator, carbohydrate utilization regulator
MNNSATSNSGFFLRIQALHDSLKKAELRLADYILSNPEETSHSTINELQKKSGSSYATIIRFSKKAGYTGFKEFKNSLVQDLTSTETVTNIAAGYHIGRADKTEEIVKKTFQSSIKTLQETQGILNAVDIQKVVEKFLGAREVYFIGTGISGVSAQYAVTRFFRIGISCTAEADPTIYKMRVSLLKKSDVLFTISSSGRSANVVDAAKIAKENGIPVISLCDFAVSPLTRNSEINLYTTPRNTTQFYDLDVQLITPQINIIDVLFFCCCSKLGTKAINFMNKTKNKADREKL